MTILPQSKFITAKNNQFYLNDTAFAFLGFNAYYLQPEASYADRRYIVDEVMEAAVQIGIKVLRCWAFNNADTLSNPGIICNDPYKYNEAGLEALDYVVKAASENNIKLILTLSNYYPDYGGIDQYLRWAKKYLPYKFLGYKRKDFFVNDVIKHWYKHYLNTILNRRNTFTGIEYKNDETIFSFELMNEGENRNQDHNSILLWYKEMGEYFKSIDNNHLLSTGETGYDAFWTNYSDITLFYNSSEFLFDGSKGTSYLLNTTLNAIDYGSFHLYSDPWALSNNAGQTWIKDHLRLADELGKPSLLGEFGLKNSSKEFYRKWLGEVENRNCRSAVIWQYLHPDVYNKDGYGFNMNDTNIIAVLKDFINNIQLYQPKLEIPSASELFQNYPNPFNSVTTIKYTLDSDDFIILELVSSIGERIGILDYGYKKKGTYELILSFNSYLFGSGVYIYSLRTSNKVLTKKLMYLK